MKIDLGEKMGGMEVPSTKGKGENKKFYPGFRFTTKKPLGHTAGSQFKAHVHGHVKSVTANEDGTHDHHVELRGMDLQEAGENKAEERGESAKEEQAENSGEALDNMMKGRMKRSKQEVMD